MSTSCGRMMGDGGGYRKIYDRTRIRRGFPNRLTPLPVLAGARRIPSRKAAGVPWNGTFTA